MFAAKRGRTLPQIPQPSHESFTANSLKISLDDDVTIQPVRTMAGTASNPAVTIKDAIGDLPLFDWDKSGMRYTLTDSKKSRVSDHIPAVKCDHKKSRSGLSTQAAKYRHPRPMTTFQRQCRLGGSIEDLQHFTRTYRKATVERYSFGIV